MDKSTSKLSAQKILKTVWLRCKQITAQEMYHNIFVLYLTVTEEQQHGGNRVQSAPARCGPHDEVPP